MANIYVRSTDGNNADDGSTWALAKADLAGADAIDNAGDTIWVSDNHDEDNTADVTLLWSGTAGNPVRILCADDSSGEPPSTLATTGRIRTTGNFDITVTNSGAIYVYGLIVDAGVSSSGSSFILMNGIATYSLFEQCTFRHSSTAANSLTIAGNSSGHSTLINCKFRFGNAGSFITPGSSGDVKILGGSIEAGGTAINTFIGSISDRALILVEGFDLSGIATTGDLVETTSEHCHIIFRNCKLPASWTGVLNGFSTGTETVIEMINCDDGDTNYIYAAEKHEGTIDHETTLVKDSGATDGTTPISWKMISNANVLYNHRPLISPPIIKWNEQIGTTLTVEVDFIHDNVTALQDDEVWLEVQYLGTSGFPLSLFADDAAADYLATPANQDTSTATWTTTGMSNPNEQRLSVSVTPQEKGYLRAIVHLARASYTIYVDPQLLIS